MTAFDWGAVKEGDPDPTSDVVDCCDAEGRFGCTRNAGHDGPHVAGDGDKVLEVWT